MIFTYLQTELLGSVGTLKGYLGPRESLVGRWEVLDVESPIDFVEYCFGTTKGGCNVQDLKRRYVEKVNDIYCMHCTIEHNHTYFFSIRVWNKAGLYSLATSNGMIADLTPPDSGKISINASYMSCAGRCNMSAELKDFEDKESGIAHCDFTIMASTNSTVIAIQTLNQTRNEINVLKVYSVPLQHGESYNFVAECYNKLEERGAMVFSSAILIDNSPPEKVII